MKATWFGLPSWSFLGVLLLLGLFLTESVGPIEQADDAYITYRYAQNLADGHGLVFNVGERVEGYTNLSWALLVAAGIRAGLTAPIAGQVLGVASGLSFLLVTFFYAATFLRPERKGWALFAPLLLLASNSFVHWTMSGLETSLFGALIVGALLAYQYQKMWVVSWLLVGATMTRPEGVILAALLLGWHWLQAVRSLPALTFRGMAVLSGPALLFAAYVVIHTGIRLYYYGAPLPNTFYAKVGGVPLVRGFSYLYESLADGAFVWLGLTALGAVWIRSIRFPFFISLVFLAYIIKVGGDVFSIGRFCLPLYPIWLAGAVAFLCFAWDRIRIIGVLALVALLASLYWALYVVWPGTRDFVGMQEKAFPALAKREFAHIHADFGITEDGLRGWVHRLREVRPDVKTIATIGIGKLGYVAMQIRILDLVGLVDAHIARSEKKVHAALILPGHHRTDSAYVISKRPDIIWIPPIGENRFFALPCIEDLWANPDLQKFYEWNPELQVWVRR